MVLKIVYLDIFALLDCIAKDNVCFPPIQRKLSYILTLKQHWKMTILLCLRIFQQEFQWCLFKNSFVKHTKIQFLLMNLQ